LELRGLGFAGGILGNLTTVEGLAIGEVGGTGRDILFRKKGVKRRQSLASTQEVERAKSPSHPASDLDTPCYSSDVSFDDSDLTLLNGR